MGVLTLGTFDLLHYGHLRLLERAASFGPLTVGVNSDRFVREYKGRTPVVPHARRAELLRGLRCVHRVVVNDGPGADTIRDVLPRILAVGGDWLGRDYPAQIDMAPDDLARYGVAVLFLPYTDGVSTTELRTRAAL